MNKKYLISAFALLCFFAMQAQDSAKDKMEEKQRISSKRTVLQRFEKKIIPNETERENRRNQIRFKRESVLMLIDTSSVIKDKHREKLKQDVMDNPFSARLKKFLALYSKDMAIVASGNEK